MQRKPKVLVYVVSGNYLLVNVHRDFPDAGIQVPGGTIEHGESSIDAAWRELEEESGLRPSAQPVIIERYDYAVAENDIIHARTVVLFNDDTIRRETFDHIVSAGEEDNGIRLQYFWIPMYLASDILIAEHGRSCNKLSA